VNVSLRRGACPGLSAPMQTGDGLLVRLLPIGTIPLASFTALCTAARQHGNGIVEVTARGGVQVRGLSPASAPHFAAAVAALGIAAADGIAVHISPLAGLDSDEILDTERLATDLRRELAEHAMAARLAPKISVGIDGGGALGLDGLPADVRLRADRMSGRTVLTVSVGGDRAGAAHLGFVAPADAVATVIHLLETIAQHGRDVRARDIIASFGVAPFKAGLGDLLLPSDASLGHDAAGARCEPIGAHGLRDGSVAFGLGLAFGHAAASSLEHLADAAAAAGARGLRTAPGRIVLAIGVAPGALQAFMAGAERLGFIVRANDPRRFVVACAGAPICASAHIAARALAPQIAAACAPALGERFTIHVSGCAKGCARPAPATLTVVGSAEGCGIVADSTARATPFAMVKADSLLAAIGAFASEMMGEVGHV
jgi:precorrin-3B synthase